MFSIDTDIGSRAIARPAAEELIWLTTVSATGAPQPSPVWFLWTGTEVLIASQPDKPKLRNAAARPVVALHFDANSTGGDVQIITGSAAIDPGRLTEQERAAYDIKYDEAIVRIGMTRDSFHAEYSEIIRIAPSKLRGF